MNNDFPEILVFAVLVANYLVESLHSYFDLAFSKDVSLLHNLVLRQLSVYSPILLLITKLGLAVTTSY